MEEIENTPSLMNKTQDELTVADNLKLTAVVAGAFIAIPMAVAGIAAGGRKAWAWYQNRKETEVETTEEIPAEEAS